MVGPEAHICEPNNIALEFLHVDLAVTDGHLAIGILRGATVFHGYLVVLVSQKLQDGTRLR